MHAHTHKHMLLGDAYAFWGTVARHCMAATAHRHVFIAHRLGMHTVAASAARPDATTNS